MKSIFHILCVVPLVFASSAQAEDIMTILARKAEMPSVQIPKTIPYSYTLILDVTEREGKEVTEGQAVLRIDPSQPAGERATIISGGDLESDALKDFLKEIEDPDNTMEKQAEEFWCDSNDDENAFSDFDLSSFTIISEDDSQAVLRPDATLLAEILMQSDSDDQMDKGERKMMEKLLKRIEGEVTLAKPNAEMLGFEVRMTRPMKMMLVAKLKEMTVKQDCEMAPNGYYHMSSFQMNVSGKALGSRFGQALNVQVSDLRPLQ